MRAEKDHNQLCHQLVEPEIHKTYLNNNHEDMMSRTSVYIPQPPGPNPVIYLNKG